MDRTTRDPAMAEGTSQGRREPRGNSLVPAGYHAARAAGYPAGVTDEQWRLILAAARVTARRAYRPRLQAAIVAATVALGERWGV